VAWSSSRSRCGSKESAPIRWFWGAWQRSFLILVSSRCSLSLIA
jgi:hypothetical protein